MTSTSDVLAYFPSPPRGIWELGPVPLRAYAFFIIVGIIVAIYWGDKRWVARGGQPGTVLDIAIWAVPFGLIGGRLYHVATDWTTYFGDGGHPIDALKIWQGGLGIWGAVLLGGVGAWIGCRLRGIPLPALGDAIAPGILLAQAIGRIGNYFNQELYGRETTVPWGMKVYERVNSNGAVDALNGVSTGVVEKVVHPTFLYELLWNVFVVVLLVLIDRKFALGHGRLFALYVAGYCVGRFGVELMRDDYATHIGGIRINTFTSAIVFLLAVAYLIFARKGRENPSDLLPTEVRDEEARDVSVVGEMDEPKVAATVPDTAKADEAEAATAVDAAPTVKKPEADKPKAEEPKSEEPKVEEPKVEKSSKDAVEKPKLEEAKAEKPKVEAKSVEAKPVEAKVAEVKPEPEPTVEKKPTIEKEAADKADAAVETAAEPAEVKKVDKPEPVADSTTEPSASEDGLAATVEKRGRQLRGFLKRRS